MPAAVLADGPCDCPVSDGAKCEVGAAALFVYDEVCDALSASDSLFVYDGSVGKSRDDQIGMRLITDCAFVASKAPELLVRRLSSLCHL